MYEITMAMRTILTTYSHLVLNYFFLLLQMKMPTILDRIFPRYPFKHDFFIYVFQRDWLFDWQSHISAIGIGPVPHVLSIALPKTKLAYI